MLPLLLTQLRKKLSILLSFPIHCFLKQKRKILQYRYCAENKAPKLLNAFYFSTTQCNHGWGMVDHFHIVSPL